MELAALRRVLHADGGDPAVTALKGAIGHTSGAAALHALDLALRCIATGTVPPVTGLRHPFPEAADVRLATSPLTLSPRLAQIDAFGFGGLNAVTLVEAA